MSILTFIIKHLCSLANCSNDRSLRPSLPRPRGHNVPFDHQYRHTHLDKQDFKVNKPYFRESSFLRDDIAGSKPKHLVSQHAREANFSLSTYV